MGSGNRHRGGSDHGRTSGKPQSDLSRPVARVAMGVDADRAHLRSCLEAARRLGLNAQSARGLAIRIRTLGLGQVLAMYQLKDPDGVGNELKQWLKPLFSDEAKRIATSALNAWTNIPHRAAAAQLELAAIKWARDLDAMLGVVGAETEAHLPRWDWHEHSREAVATQVMWTLSGQGNTPDPFKVLARGVGQATPEQVRECLTIGLSRDPSVSSPLVQRLQALPLQLRRQGLPRTLAMLHNEGRSRGGRSGLANLLYARLRGHGLLGEHPSLRPTQAVSDILANTPEAEGAYGALTAEAEAWAVALKRHGTIFHQSEKAA